VDNDRDAVANDGAKTQKRQARSTWMVIRVNGNPFGTPRRPEADTPGNAGILACLWAAKAGAGKDACVPGERNIPPNREIMRVACVKDCGKARRKVTADPQTYRHDDLVRPNQNGAGRRLGRG